MSDSQTATENRIRERAFELWQQAGCPEGRAEEFWRLAEETESTALEPPTGDT